MNIDVKQIAGLGAWLGSFTAALVSRPRAQTIAVLGLLDEGTITHNLESEDLIAHFLKDGRTQSGFDIEPIDNNSFKVYLPILANGENSFTGKIFIIKAA